MKKLIFTIGLIVIFNCTINIDICQCQWVQMSNGFVGGVNCLSSSGNNIVAGSSGNGIYLSTNLGSNWSHIALNSQIILSMASSGNNVFAGGQGIGIYRSTNNGVNWAQTSLTNHGGYALAINGNYIFAGAMNIGVYLSTNIGANWTQTSLNNQTIYSLIASGNNVFAGTDGNGVFISTNNGTSWTQTSLNNTIVHALAFNGANIFAGTDQGGVYLSTNNGTNWTQTTLTQSIRELVVNSGNIFAGSDNGSVYLSTNNGSNWIQKNQGFPVPNIELLTLLISNNYIYSGNYNGSAIGSVWRRSLTEIIGIEPISEIVPDKFVLHQNYPNPFNPATKIRFDVASSLSFPSVSIGNPVKLIVYDVMGREVQTLVSERLNPGTYEVTFDGSALNSGVYFYKISAGDFSDVKRMVLIK